MALTRPTKIAAVVVALLAAASLMWHMDFSPTTPVNAATVSLLTPRGNDYVLGNPKAPVTIIEYFSLSCSHCAHFHNDVLPELTTKYLETGKAKLITRSYVRNEPDLKATMLLNCAPRDKYHAFVSVLFKQQEKWAFDERFLDSLKIIAGVGGISADKFNQCMADTKSEIAILKERNDASQALLINSTPTFFINGKKYEGVPDAASFAQAIDAAAAGAK